MSQFSVVATLDPCCTSTHCVGVAFSWNSLSGKWHRTRLERGRDLFSARNGFPGLNYRKHRCKNRWIHFRFFTCFRFF